MKKDNTLGKILSTKVKDLEPYLNKMREVFAHASIGDFSKRIKISEKEDAFTEVFIGLNLLLDVVNEKVAELETAYAKDESVLKSIGEGLIVTDQKGRVNFINRAAKNMLACTDTEMLGKLWDIDLPRVEDEQGKIISPFSGDKKNEEQVPLQCYYIRKDQSKFPIDFVTSKVTSGDKVLGTIIIFRDITEQIEIDRSKTEFVSIVSHQLRTPLSAIKWYTEVILGQSIGKINDKQRKYLNEIHTGNQKMVSLVSSLLNMSRIELGTLATDIKNVDIIENIKAILTEISPIVTIKKLHISKKFPKKLLVDTDSKLFSVIVQNLITNAVNYTPEKGSVNITITKGKSKITLIVKDSGYGIPKSEQNKIFTKFFRAQNAKLVSQEGTGLGLYINKVIIEKVFGGKIWFESEENKGTTFFVELPTKLPKAISPKLI